MIENEHQLEYTRRKLQDLKADLAAIRKKYSGARAKVALLGQGYREHIAQLGPEVRQHEATHRPRGR